MKKLKAFLYIFKNSVSNPSYSLDILKADVRFSFKYFAVLAVVASIVTFVFTVLPATKGLGKVATDLKETAVKAYPQDLIISINGGEMNINKPEPYFIKMPNDPTMQNVETPANAVVLDSSGTINDMEAYDTWVLVNKKNILMRNTNKIEVFPLSDFPDEEFTAEDIKTLATFFDPFIKALPYIVMAFSFLLLLVYFLGIKAFNLLFVALVLLIIGRVNGISISFAKYYQIGIHALTLPLVLELLADAANITISFPFWFFGLTLIIGVLGIVRIGSKSSTN